MYQILGKNIRWSQYMQVFTFFYCRVKNGFKNTDNFPKSLVLYILILKYIFLCLINSVTAQCSRQSFQVIKHSIKRKEKK